ncbi:MULTISPECIES: sensor histidine kinase [unclassified Paenibacillus]|uniref:sensor histidine kinase n=1 Tax=unclassified Paenibacillus TaxID=185978 RepID=UPI0036404158
MRLKLNIFKKIMLFIIILLIPIVILYSYSNQVSVTVVEDEIQNSNLNRLSFFTSQMDNIVNQLSITSIIVSKDQSIKELLDTSNQKSMFEQLRLQESIVGKLNLLSATSSWSNRLTIYFPKTKQVVSNDYNGVYDPDFLRKNLKTHWEYHPQEAGDAYFTKFMVSPLISYLDPEDAEAIIEVRFFQQNLINMLSDFQQVGKGTPFLYYPGEEPIMNTVSDPTLIHKLVARLDSEHLEPLGHLIVEMNQEKYLVDYVKSKNLDCYLVDFVPLEKILSPIVKSRNLFYFSIGLLLIMSIVVALLLYKQVQIPIKWLLRGVHGIRSGQYAMRLHYNPNNEFDYLFLRFNEMAGQIQELVEKVYMENIRYREAKLKHLQSQINPHFLYNCLFFIKNMIAVGDKQAATAMVLNLGDYYRYITKLENAMTTLQDEMNMVQNYLNIQNLRIERFHYEIDIPESMAQLVIPRLMIQPIVENAIVHGIGKMERYGIISIEGSRTETGNRIIIDDNGIGMSDERLAELQQRVALPMEEEMSCGLWNVHQRLLYQFNKNSGLVFSHSPQGGIRVEIRWEE